MIIVVLLLLGRFCYGQHDEEEGLISTYTLSELVINAKNLNLDFEYRYANLYNGYILPQNWFTGDGGRSLISHPDSAGYQVFLDSIEKHSGRYSLKMELPGVKTQSNHGLFTGKLPITVVAGKNVEYRGWIKTKDVKDGYAGLWFLVSGDNKKVLGFNNGKNRGLKGNNEWTQVSIKIKVSKDVTKFTFGGLFNGEGTVWFDNLEFYIDGKKFVDYEPTL